MKERGGAEPFKIKMVEPVGLTTKAQREEILKKAGYNQFRIPAEYVYIDLMTDSGTSAMSDNQWAGIMMGDESYAGARNFYHLRDTVREIFTYEYVIPTHQGRAAENILMSAVLWPGKYVLGNMFFDTTEAHIAHKGCKGVSFMIPEAYDTQSTHPFKGNVDVVRLEEFIRKEGASKVGMIIITVTCNNNGGQPVSMENVRQVSAVARKYGIPLFFDSARFAENCYFIKKREAGYGDRSILEIANEMFSYGDGATCSAKKSALVNIGGFLAMNSKELYDKCLEYLVLFEGFATYGGLAGRDLEAMARGLREGLDEAYLEDRIGQVEYLASALMEAGASVVLPPGGHAAYVDCKKTVPHLSWDKFPADSLGVALYLDCGVRTVGLGALAFAEKDPVTGEWVPPELELLRLAVPRRVYTDRHMNVVAEAMGRVLKRPEQIRGLRLVKEPARLRHFLSELEPI
ncbi:MAG TPA: tryptophanase [Firmicutes bacterium]|nr:tryptophanase [Bacillota bacterium]